MPSRTWQDKAGGIYISAHKLLYHRPAFLLHRPAHHRQHHHLHHRALEVKDNIQDHPRRRCTKFKDMQD